MGNINTDVGSLRDLITEEVGCKSGLLLTDRQACDVLKRAKHAEVKIFERSRDSPVRMRPEEIEDVIVNLRHRLGNLPDAAPPIMARIRWTKALWESGIDPTPIYKAFETIISSHKYKVIGEEAANEMVDLSGMSELLVGQFLMHTANQMDRSVSWFQARIVDLGWALPLQAVFDSEAVPSDPETYLDQRYIDYFHHNDEDLNRMHWRNFERLTSEFFHRHGYEVQIGPGTKDGGVDVRVWPTGSEKTGPPLIIVQCKRYGRTNNVSLETVKALWSDVVYEEAYRGLIATTSRVSPEGKKISSGRHWPLGFAEHDQVAHWIKTMWRFAPKLPS